MSSNFSLTNTTQYPLPVGFAKTANQLLKITDRQVKQSYESISWLIVEAADIKQLNKHYRHHNKVTDVLSFILQADPLIGEIVISYQQAVKQAARRGHSLKQELIILTIHGLVHLFGYDHIKLKDRQVMRPLEHKILKIYEQSQH